MRGLEFLIINVQEGHGMANITSFSAASGSQFTVDGQSVEAANANKSWSLTEPDANTLQFSVHSGDNWSTSGWSDATNDRGANRSEIEFSQKYAAGTQINVSEQLTIQPGPTNTASFLDLNQLHSTTQSPPSPFTLQLDKSDHLEVVLQSPNNSYNLVYRSPDPIVRGQPMNLNFQLNMNPNGNGYVGVWLDGNQIVNYHGAVGATGSEYYWKEGIYRGSAAETMTADFSNVQITTGPASAPTGGTSVSGGSSSTGTTTGTGTGVSSGSGTVTDPTGGTHGGGSSASGSSSSTGGTTGTGTGTSSGSGTVTDPTGGTHGSGSSASGGSSSAGGTTGTGTGTSSGSGTVTNPTGGTHGGGSSASGGSSTVGTGASGGTTPPTAPTVTVADPSLSVSPGHGVDLGVGVKVPTAGDNVTVNIKGLPSYETITDKLDGKSFSGSNVTLTAAQVNSGLTLNSSYEGNGHPTSTLTVTATDQTSHSSSAAQSIAVTDPTSSSTTGTSGSGSTGSGSTASSGSSSHGGWSGHQWSGAQWGGHHSDISQWFDSHPGFAKTAKTLSDAFSSKSGASSAAGSSTNHTASAGDKAYALFNQMMAGDFGNTSHFTQGGSSSAQNHQQASNLLTRPLH
jgi:hypothetical protein